MGSLPSTALYRPTVFLDSNLRRVQVFSVPRGNGSTTFRNISRTFTGSNRLAQSASVANLKHCNGRDAVAIKDRTVNARVVWALLGGLATPVQAADLQVEVRVDVQRGCQLIGQQRGAGI